MVALMDIYKIWVVIYVFRNLLNHPMVNAMEMVCVTHIMEKPLTTVLQIADVEINTVNINLEKLLTIARKIVGSVETANVIHLRVVPPANKTVEHV